MFSGVSESSTAGLKVLQKTWNGPERRGGVSQRVSTFPTCTRSRPKAHKHSGTPLGPLISLSPATLADVQFGGGFGRARPQTGVSTAARRSVIIHPVDMGPSSEVM